MKGIYNRTLASELRNIRRRRRDGRLEAETRKKKLANKLYAATHRKEINARVRGYYAANPEKYRLQSRERYARNKEQIAERRAKKRKKLKKQALRYCATHGWWNQANWKKCPSCTLPKRKRTGELRSSSKKFRQEESEWYEGGDQ